MHARYRFEPSPAGIAILATFTVGTAYYPYRPQAVISFRDVAKLFALSCVAAAKLSLHKAWLAVASPWMSDSAKYSYTWDNL